MATNVQKIVASAGGRYLTITPASAGVNTECVLVGMDGDTVLYRYPMGSGVQEVDLQLIGDCFLVCVQGDYSYTRSATSEIAVGGDLTIAGTLKEILIELKKKLSNLHLSIIGLKNISDAQAEEINDLEEMVATIEGNIAGIQNGIVSIQENVAGHTVALGQITDSIVALEALTDGYKAGLQADVDALESTVAGHATSIASVASEVDALQALTSTLKNNIQATVDALASTVAGHTSTLSTHAGKITTLEGASSSQAGRLGTAEGKISTLETAKTTHDGKISTLENTTANHGTRLSTAESDINALETLLNGHIADLGEMQDQLDTLSGTVNDLVLGGDETETAAALQQLQDSDSALSLRVSAVETGLTGKAPTSHTHDYAPSSHTHSYAPMPANVNYGVTQCPALAVGQIAMLDYNGNGYTLKTPSGGQYYVISSQGTQSSGIFAGNATIYSRSEGSDVRCSALIVRKA